MNRVGIGGWTFAPWRDNFYPAKLPHAQELAYASRHVTAIEINGTFYRTQSAASFRKWKDETPDDFVFSVKGHRAVVNKKDLGEAGEAIDWFLGSGIAELGDKLGPILWQMPAYKRFDATEIAAFFSALPVELEGRRLVHAFEPRHDSFKDLAFIELARSKGIAIVCADSAKYPSIADTAGDLVYARLQNADADEPLGYPGSVLDQWATRIAQWATGDAAGDLPLLAPPAPKVSRDVFVFMINGAKERAPAAAMGLIERLGGPAP